MIAAGRRSTSEATRRQRVYPGGQIAYKAEWMQTGEDPHFSPTVFLYEQPGDTSLSAHFHHNNQFQIFIEGEGKIGPRKIAPVVVHYAGAYTGYGPLLAGPDGLKYFTLRSVHESGAVRVADVRAGKASWPKGPMRHATSQQIAVSAAGTLTALQAIRETALIPRAEDGLEVVSIEMPPARSCRQWRSARATACSCFSCRDRSKASLMPWIAMKASTSRRTKPSPGSSAGRRVAIC